MGGEETGRGLALLFVAMLIFLLDDFAMNFL